MKSLLSFITVCLFLGCQSKWQGTIEEKDGVRIIDNPAIGLLQGKKLVEIKEMMTIGIEDGDDNYLFSNPVSIVTDSTDAIYIVDLAENIVKKYDKEGRFVMTIGRPGRGPGEFLSPYVVALSSAKLFIADFGTNRISVFALTGTFLTSKQMPFYIGDLAARRDGRIVVFARHGERILHFLNQQLNILESFVQPWQYEDHKIDNIPTINSAFLISDESALYLCPYMLPFTLYKFDNFGKPVANIRRASPEYIPMKWQDAIISPGSIAKGFAVFPDGLILVCVELSSETSNGDSQTKSVWYFYAADGRYLLCRDLPAWPRWVDQHGFLYAIKKKPFPQIIKYLVSFH